MSSGDRQRVTVTDVARAAGVSTATVTRTLQKPDVVKAATRERVMEAVRRLGYSPNPMARNLRHGSPSGVVGLVTAGFTNIFQAWVAAGAEAELRRNGLQLLIGSTDDDPAREPELARIMIDRRVSALLMMPDGDDRDFLRPEYTYGTPVVLVGRPANGLDVDVVMTTDDQAVDEATDQLLRLGHRRIAALAGRAGSFRAAQRLSGYRAALARHAVPEPRDLVVTGLTSPQEINAAVTELMQRPQPPTAVLALNLGISSGVLLDRIVNRRDTAFVALDENDLSAGLGISAITRDPFELGRQAALLALERIADPTARPRTVTLPSVLVRRGSGELPPPSAADGVPAAVPHEVVQSDGSGVARD
ncbi:LacI family DNA-binding transcriptional regulator [Streptomyces sp. URMC 128]|uniref:LacI family DNA-binding transcriptional regulator n=1 Tax=Streptomyces sp. URMC 128 TaxID=3423404 RepID=UPI003F1C09C1